MGFNTFLPAGYRIESTNNPDDPIAVYTPHDQSGYYNVSSNAIGANLPLMSQLPGFKYGIQETVRQVALPPINSLSRQINSVGFSGSSFVPNVGNTIGNPVVNSSGVQNTLMNTSIEDTEETKPARPVLHPPEHKAPVEFNQAINYVNKIKVILKY